MRNLITLFVLLGVSAQADVVTNEDRTTMIKEVFSEAYDCSARNFNYEPFLNEKCIDQEVEFLKSFTQKFILDPEGRVIRNLNKVKDCPKKNYYGEAFLQKTCIENEFKDISFELDIISEDNDLYIGNNSIELIDRLKTLKSLLDTMKSCKVKSDYGTAYYRQACVANKTKNINKIFKISLSDSRDVERDLLTALKCQVRNFDYKPYLLKSCVETSISNVQYDLNQMGETELLKAVSLGDLNKVKEILNTSTEEIDQFDVLGRTALIIAIQEEDLAIANYLLDQGANPSLFDGTEAPVFEAFKIGATSLVKKLVKKGAAKDALNRDKESLLTLSAKENKYDLARFLFNNDYDFTTEFNGNSAFNLVISVKEELAIEMANKLEVKELSVYVKNAISASFGNFVLSALDRGYVASGNNVYSALSRLNKSIVYEMITKENLETTFNDGRYLRGYILDQYSGYFYDLLQMELFTISDAYRTNGYPLSFRALDKGITWIGQFIKEDTFDVKPIISNHTILTKLIRSEINNSLKFDILKVILSKGGDLYRQVGNTSAMEIAFVYNLGLYTKLLDENYTSIDKSFFKGGSTPLKYSFTFGNGMYRRFVIERNADFSVKENSGNSYIEKVLENEYIRELYLTKGNFKGINEVFSTGETPVTKYVKEGNFELLKLLLNRSEVDVNALNENSSNALHLAAEIQNEELIDILLTYNPDKSLIDGSGRTAYQIVKDARDDVFFLGFFKKARLKKLMEKLK